MSSLALQTHSASANTGDWHLRETITRGEYLGWYWSGAEWVKIGLSDTGNLAILVDLVVVMLLVICN